MKEVLALKIRWLQLFPKEFCLLNTNLDSKAFFVTQRFLGSLITNLYSDLKSSKWWIWYGDQVNLINFRGFKSFFSKTWYCRKCLNRDSYSAHGAILFAQRSPNLLGCIMYVWNLSMYFTNRTHERYNLEIYWRIRINEIVWNLRTRLKEEPFCGKWNNNKYWFRCSITLVNIRKPCKNSRVSF